MSGSSETVDCTAVDDMNERIRAWAEPGVNTRPIEIRKVVIAENALAALCDTAAEFAQGGVVGVVEDHTPMHRGSDDLKSLIEESLAGKCKTRVHRLPSEPNSPLHAEIEITRQLAEQLSDCAAIVAFGSGTVTDVAKYARHLIAERSGRVQPMISFPTAASVTAYSSALAVLTIQGVKRTLPARAPDAIICDLQSIANAPLEMSRAGFGDVLARSVSFGDWFLANCLGLDDGFSMVPAQLLQHAEKRMLDSASDIAQRDMAAIRHLTEAILLSGMAMSVMNQTAPLSGWEHAMSHYLDLTAGLHERRTGLHGAQVGVTTLISARAYERGWPDLDLNALTEPIDERAYRNSVESHFAVHDCSGGLVEELWNDLSRKIARWNAAAETRTEFARRHQSGEIDAFLTAHVRPSRVIAQALRQVAAPDRVIDLSLALSSSWAIDMVLHSHLIRSRLTYGDLLAHCGWLDEGTASSLLD